MRRELWMVATLLPLGGCYVPQDSGYGYAQPPGVYAQPGYPPGGYAPPGYAPPGYAPPGYDPYAGTYPGYSYNGGAPTIIEGGMTAPLVLFGGEWGYYDRDRHWHHAPDRVSRDLDAHRGNGGHFRPNDFPRGAPNFQPGPGHFGSPGASPAAAPPAAFRPGEPPRAVAPQAAFRPGEPPRPIPSPAAIRPSDAPRSAAPVGVMPRTVPAQPPHSSNCPPGQHC